MDVPALLTLVDDELRRRDGEQVGPVVRGVSFAGNWINHAALTSANTRAWMRKSAVRAIGIDAAGCRAPFAERYAPRNVWRADYEGMIMRPSLRPPRSARMLLRLFAAGSVLQHHAFAQFWLARVATMMAYQMLSVAVGWHVYELTDSALDLGLIGLAQFLPSIVLVLIVGHVADRYDRRRIARITMILGVMASAGIPGMVGLISEFLVFRGSFLIFPVQTLLCMVGSGLTAVYFLLLVNRVFFGRLAIAPPTVAPQLDIDLPMVPWRDRAPALGLAVLIIAFGL
jgi:hypothetical protein